MRRVLAGLVGLVVILAGLSVAAAPSPAVGLDAKALTVGDWHGGGTMPPGKWRFNHTSKKAYGGSDQQRHPSLTVPPSPFTGPGYYYAGARQILTGTDRADGLAASMYVSNTYVQNNAGEHSLYELAAQGPTGNTVEFGIVRFGTGNIKLFGSTWNAGVWNGCYDGSTPLCFFVDNTSNPIDLGADLSATAALCNGTSLACVKKFAMYWSVASCGPAASGWRLDYDNVNVGCYMPNAFTGGFTNAQQFQAFGEVYYGGATKPRTDMGNGKDPNLALGNTGPAYIGSVSLVNAFPSTVLTDLTANTSTDTAAYDLKLYVDANGKHRTLAVDGAGYNAAGGLPGVVGG